MAVKKSIFFEEWKRCLREHYLHVVRTNDMVTEPTLHGVLMKTGFTEHEIHALYELALCQQQYGDDPFCGQAYEEFLAQGETTEFNKPPEPLYPEEEMPPEHDFKPELTDLEGEPYSEPLAEQNYPDEAFPENDSEPEPIYLEDEPSIELLGEQGYSEEILPEHDSAPKPAYLEQQPYLEEITPENNYPADNEPLELFSAKPLLDILDESAPSTKQPKKKKSKPATPPPSSADTGQQSLF